MLNSFRKGGLIQFMMGGVIIMIIAAFALDSRGPASSFEAECVVSVGERCVPPRDFTAAFQLAVRPDLTPKELRRLQVRRMLLEGLVERELLVTEAERLGISISEEKVDAELALGRFHFSLPAERDGQLPMLTYVNVRHPETDAFNFEIYQRVVRNYARMSSKDFKAHQTHELIASRMRDLSKVGVLISEPEAFAQFEHDNSKATVRVAQLSSSWFARFLTAPSDSQVQAYATEHVPEVDAAAAATETGYFDGCALVSEIFFGFPPAADAQDEAETRARAERVAAQAARGDGAAFATLARVHSTAPSASHGGKRGCIAVSAEAPVSAEAEENIELLGAIKGVSPGSLTKLVQVPRGFYLLRVEQRVAKDELVSMNRLWAARPLAVRAEADRLTREFAEALKTATLGGASMQDALDALTTNALEGIAVAGQGAKPSELETAALESRERPQIDVSPSFSRGGVANPIPNAKADSAAKQLAFTLKAVGDVYPEPIETDTGLAVLQLKELEPAKREDFEKEKVEFMRELKARAGFDALAAFIARLRKAHAGEIVVNERYLEEKDRAADDS
jgi:peptidyl-prolyl cis-trans isomerase D